MCGIVGLIVKGTYGPHKAQEDAFYDMLVCDTLRGDDATGVIFVENNSDFSIMKDQWQAWWTAPEIKESDIGKRMFNKGKAFIGHNRKATMGKRTSETAHPFVVNEKFAMVHNGTLRNHQKIAQTDVDSEALTILLEPVLGVNYTKEAFEEAMGKVDGAYAVVAYNQETNKVYLFRNHERPLSIIETNTSFFFGSEFGLVQWCAARNNNDLKDMKAEVVQTNTLYTIDLNTNKMTKEEYLPKKAFPPVTMTRVIGTGGTDSAVGNPSSKLSKQKFKLIKRKLIGTTLQFWADDWVEKGYPKTLADGETIVQLMGTMLHDDVLLGQALEHFVQAEYDVSSLKGEDPVNRIFSGRVEELAYNNQTGSVTLFLGNAKILPKSVVKNETKTLVH